MTEHTVVRVSGPGELVQAVPYLLGYRPRASLVLLELDGPRRRVGATACVPLPPPGRVDLLEDVVGSALGPLLVEGASRVLAIVYVRRRPSSTGAPPERAVIRALRRRAESEGAQIEDEIAVWEDRWWSYRCSDARCCPPEGRLVEPPGLTSTIVAAMVAEGVAPAESREELAASLEPDHAARSGIAPAVSRVREQMERSWGPLGRRAVLAALRRLLADPAGRRAGTEGSLAVDDAALVLVGLGDVGTRDAAMGVVAGTEPHVAIAALVPLVRAAPRELVAPVASVLASRAYAQGNGALANVAVDRALAEDPGYSLALLLRELLAAGVHPRHVHDVVASLLEGEDRPTTA